MPPQSHVQHNGHPGLHPNPWVGIPGTGIPGDPWGSMHHHLGYAQELKQEIKPLPGDYGRAVHHPMHHPSGIECLDEKLWPRKQLFAMKSRV